jgi:hypothetical protein
VRISCCYAPTEVCGLGASESSREAAVSLSFGYHERHNFKEGKVALRISCGAEFAVL